MKEKDNKRKNPDVNNKTDPKSTLSENRLLDMEANKCRGNYT